MYFAVFCTACKGSHIEGGCFWASAVNHYEAEGMAMEWYRKLFPISDGWQNHTVGAYQVPSEITAKRSD